MYGGSYNYRWVMVQAGNERLRALTFVVNRAHPRYVPELSVEQTAQMIAAAKGELGSCQEYLENTIAHLRQLGVRDAGLERIAAALPKR
jgi:cation transport protein ChaC